MLTARFFIPQTSPPALAAYTRCVYTDGVFTWDEKKRLVNLKDHRLDFIDAEEVFAGAIFTFEDDRFDYGERRWAPLGLLRGLVVSIVHTETDEAIHVISMRKATKRENKIFYENIAD